MTAADRKLRIVYDGEDLTVQEWADRTGLPYATIYQRHFVRKWSAEEALTTPYRSSGGRTPGRGPVEYARSLAAGSNWMVALRLAIVLMALQDYEDPYYRTDVELFFRDEFEKLIVLIAVRLDLLLGINYIRDAVIIGFVANEVISIVENAGLMGLPMPAAIIKAIDVLTSKAEQPGDDDAGEAP